MVLPSARVTAPGVPAATLRATARRLHVTSGAPAFVWLVTQPCERAHCGSGTETNELASPKKLPRLVGPSHFTWPERKSHGPTTSGVVLGLVSPRAAPPPAA